jgi:hypothetical protein
MAEGRKKKGILALGETKMRFFAFFLYKNLQSPIFAVYLQCQNKNGGFI